jgi:hypothetical protein
MARPTSIRRCPLAQRERAIRDAAGVPEDLRVLGVNVTRRIRRDSPGAPVLMRMAQSLAVAVWWKAMTTEETLLTLNRALAEFNRSLRVLGVAAPGARGRYAKPGGTIFRPPAERAMPEELADVESLKEGTMDKEGADGGANDGGEGHELEG